MALTPAVKIGNIEVLMRQLKKPEVGKDGYDGSESFVKNLPAGHRRTASSKQFEVDTVWEKDIEIPLRDGTILKGDVFRPDQSDRVPAIIPWSPYGKTGRGQQALRIPRRCLDYQAKQWRCRCSVDQHAWTDGYSPQFPLRLREV